ncbi:MAG TPA: aquaporin [Thermoleophilaceae bacterium]|nr:aquaporin [Thermoleophilaceae bacterium]
MQDRGPSAYIAEFIGTFALVFFVTAAVSLYVAPPPAFTDFGVIGLVHVFVLFILIQTLAVASGAHFNPAVTIALTALRQIKPPDAGIYIITQLAGGVAGGLVTKLLLEDEGGRVNYGAVAVNPERFDSVILPGMVAEFIGTFFLVFVIVGVAVNPHAAKDWAALAIGAALGLGVMVLAPLTGAGFNPARAFGPALVAGEFGGVGNFLLIYVLAPILGALAAAIGYFRLYITPGKKGEAGLGPVG